MVSGMPSSSVKNFCTGVLHRFTHMPAQPLSARYLPPSRTEIRYKGSSTPTIYLHEPRAGRSITQALSERLGPCARVSQAYKHVSQSWIKSQAPAALRTCSARF